MEAGRSYDISVVIYQNNAIISQKTTFINLLCPETRSLLKDYWVLGLCPSSGILKNTKEKKVSVQRLRLALYNGPSRVGVSHPPPEDRNRSSFRNVVFFNIP
jgi:hypothetical protein